MMRDLARFLRPVTIAALMAAVTLALAPGDVAAQAQEPPPAQPPPSGAPEQPVAASAAEAAEPMRPGTGRIRGIVTDASRRPRAGLLVTLVSLGESGLLRVTSTDEKGRYLFKDLVPGRYDVRIEAEGFRPALKTGVEVRPPFQNIVDVRLEPAPTAGAIAGATAGAAAVTTGVSGGPGTGNAGGAGGAMQGEAAPPAAGAVVHGLLLDADRQPVVEVSILLSGGAGGRLYQAISDSAGAFRIENVDPGAYRVIVRSPGHVPVDLKAVEVTPVNGLDLRLTLVDYPLNFKQRPEGSPPQEVPRREAPPPAPPPSSPAPPPASSPAPGAR